MLEKQEEKEQEVEQSCVFTPNINSEFSSKALTSSTPNAKGVAKFLERQKVAMEARKEKELYYQNRDIGSNWVRKTTVPEEFSLSSSSVISIQFNSNILYYSQNRIRRIKKVKEYGKLILIKK